MPNQCIVCGAIYPDNTPELINGCPKCGSKVFYYFKESQKKEVENIKLTEEEKKEIEQEVYDLIGIDKDNEKPIILDIEAVRILKPGKYELDLTRLLNKNPLVFRLEEGKYYIDLPESLKEINLEKNKK